MRFLKSRKNYYFICSPFPPPLLIEECRGKDVKEEKKEKEETEDSFIMSYNFVT